jgi:hypothetical protein
MLGLGSTILYVGEVQGLAQENALVLFDGEEEARLVLKTDVYHIDRMTKVLSGQAQLLSESTYSRTACSFFVSISICCSIFCAK